MKPRQREPQKQTSRLYARGNDHRELIFYDDSIQKYIYHNAVYWTETDDASFNKDHLAWVKYPRHAMVLPYGGSNNESGAICIMDVDRQFQYGYGFGGAIYGIPQVYGLENGVCVAVNRTRGFISYSGDGFIWKQMSITSMNPNNNSMYHFGEDSLCWIQLGSVVMDQHYPLDHAGFTLGVITFTKDEDTGEITVEGHTYSYVDIVRTCQFVCNTKQGAVFNTTYGANFDSSGHMGAFDYTFWHIDHAGVKTEKHKDLWATNTIWDNLKSFAYAKVGNRCFAITAVENKTIRTGIEYYARCHLLCSDDHGATWTGNMIYELHTDVYNLPSIAVNMYAMDGEVFGFYAVNTSAEGNQVHMMSTLTGTQWDEVNLPSWLDVPVIDDGGTCVNPSPSKQTIRIAVDPKTASNYDYTLRSMLGNPEYDSNMRGKSVMFSGGELVKETDEEYRFCFGGLGSGDYCAYFDNRYLAENANAFAWQIKYYSQARGYPDYVIPYDYVLG